MSKSLNFWRKCAATAATAATFVATQVATLFPQSGSTVATLMVRRIQSIFPSKSAIFGASSGSSGNSFSNSSQEIDDLREGNDNSPSGGDEYDKNDYELWEAAFEDMCNDVGWPDWHLEEKRGASWEQQAVDEIIDSERPGEYPANLPDDCGDIPF